VRKVADEIGLRRFRLAAVYEKWKPMTWSSHHTGIVYSNWQTNQRFNSFGALFEVRRRIESNYLVK